MNRNLLLNGFILMLLALVAAFFVPAMKIPRLAVSAHTIGMLSGVLLLAVGAIWQQFVLSRGQKKWMAFAWLYSSYANWAGCLLGAMVGAGRSTPVAAGGAVGSDGLETLVGGVLLSVALASLVAAGLSILGLWRRAEGDG